MKNTTTEERLEMVKKLKRQIEEVNEYSYNNDGFSSEYVEFKEKTCEILEEWLGISVDIKELHEIQENNLYLDEDHYPCKSSTLYVECLDVLIEVDATHHREWDYSIVRVEPVDCIDDLELEGYIFGMLGNIRAVDSIESKTPFLNRGFKKLGWGLESINTFIAALIRQKYASEV